MTRSLPAGKYSRRQTGRFYVVGSQPGGGPLRGKPGDVARPVADYIGPGWTQAES